MNLPEEHNEVGPGEVCPRCQTADADQLVWLDDERVQCQRCGYTYWPGVPELEDEPQ